MEKLIFHFCLFVFGENIKKKYDFWKPNPEKPPRTLVEVVVKVEGEANVALGLVAVEHDVGLRQGEVGEEWGEQEGRSTRESKRRQAKNPEAPKLNNH